MVNSEVTKNWLEIDFADLELYEKLGRGSFGSVYRAKWLSKGFIVAAKQLLALDREVEVLNILSHKNIVKFFGAVTKSPNYYIVTEYAENGSLYDFLRGSDNTSSEEDNDENIEFGYHLDFSRILTWAKEIAQGINYLHNEAPIKTIHRDLKSKNVVLSANWTCKICDFGASRFMKNTTKMSWAGTIPWMAPEVIQQHPTSTACDAWSYGVVLWELLTLEIPFDGLEGARIFFSVVELGVRLTIPSTCPPSFEKLMTNCWETDPKERPTFQQILQSLARMMADADLENSTNSFLGCKDQWKFQENMRHRSINNIFSETRPKRMEIEAKLNELKKMETSLKNREQELTRREDQIKQFQQNSLLNKRSSVDLTKINTWLEEDVADWFSHLPESNGLSSEDLTHYAILLQNNNITGKRLLKLTSDDLKRIGITSFGHYMTIMAAINDLQQQDESLQHFPPLTKPSPKGGSPASPPIKKDICLIFGSHIHHSPKQSQGKWKIYVDVDDDDNNLTSALSCIKDVLFVCKFSPFPVYRVKQPPYIMDKWHSGIEAGYQVECIVNYQDKVKKPRNTKYVYTFGRTLSPNSEEKSISVDIEQTTHNFQQSSLENSPSLTSIYAAQPLDLQGAWKNRSMAFVPASPVTVRRKSTPNAKRSATSPNLAAVNQSPSFPRQQLLPIDSSAVTFTISSEDERDSESTSSTVKDMERFVESQMGVQRASPNADMPSAVLQKTKSNPEGEKKKTNKVGSRKTSAPASFGFRTIASVLSSESTTVVKQVKGVQVNDAELLHSIKSTRTEAVQTDPAFFEIPTHDSSRFRLNKNAHGNLSTKRKTRNSHPTSGDYDRNAYYRSKSSEMEKPHDTKPLSRMSISDETNYATNHEQRFALPWQRRDTDRRAYHTKGMRNNGRSRNRNTRHPSVSPHANLGRDDRWKGRRERMEQNNTYDCDNNSNNINCSYDFDYKHFDQNHYHKPHHTRQMSGNYSGGNQKISRTGSFGLGGSSKMSMNVHGGLAKWKRKEPANIGDADEE